MTKYFLKDHKNSSSTSGFNRVGLSSPGAERHANIFNAKSTSTLKIMTRVFALDKKKKMFFRNRLQ